MCMIGALIKIEVPFFQPSGSKVNFVGCVLFGQVTKVLIIDHQFSLLKIEYVFTQSMSEKLLLRPTAKIHAKNKLTLRRISLRTNPHPLRKMSD